MKRPQHFEFKQWLCRNTIVGLRIHYIQTGTDTARTEWELIPMAGTSKKVSPEVVAPLVELKPDWVRVLQVKQHVLIEFKEYEEFTKKEAADLAEYERLKKKFEN